MKMKQKTLPTPNELIKLIGLNTYKSVAHGNSRAILNHLEKPVVGYMVGLGGFVAIFENGHGFLKSVGYSARHTWGNNPLAGFCDIEPEKAEELIRNNKLPAIVEIDEKRLMNLKQRSKYKQLIIGMFSLEHHNQYGKHSFTTQIKQFKNGKLFAVSNRYWGGFSRLTLGDALRDYETAKRGYDTDHNGYRYKVEFTKNTMTQEILDKIEKQVVAQVI